MAGIDYKENPIDPRHRQYVSAVRHHCLLSVLIHEPLSKQSQTSNPDQNLVHGIIANGVLFRSALVCPAGR
jgi:hypothetical protein